MNWLNTAIKLRQLLLNSSGNNASVVLSQLPPEVHKELAKFEWLWCAREEQLPPIDEDWGIWYIETGRGWGKTRTASEFINASVRYGGFRRVHLVGATAADVRDIMVDGESGILATSRDDFIPSYVPSRREVIWPNGVKALTFTSEAPRRLRGPECDLFWGDEIAYWEQADQTWSNLELGWRIGKERKGVLTTTPRPTSLVRKIRTQKKVVMTKGATRDNRENLSPDFYNEIVELYGGTRIGKQELEGILLEDNPAALWDRADIDRDRVTKAGDVYKIVVGVDPAANESGNEWGIVVAAVTQSRPEHFFILGDYSRQASGNAAAAQCVTAYHKHEADEIVYEANHGGDMVRDLIHNVDPNVPTRKVYATRGKKVRAEPVAALQEQRRLHMAGIYDKLEDELCYYSDDIRTEEDSPNRMDAMVWAVTSLMRAGRVRRRKVRRKAA